MDDLVKVIPLSLELCPRSPGTKTPLWYQINCMWLKRQNVLLAVMGSRKGLTVNQLCFSSAMNMNYDNLDILVVKPKRQENQSFWVPAKVCGTRTSRQKHGSDLQFISRLSHPHQNQWHISHPSLSNHSSWEAWNHQLGWLSRKVCEGVSNADTKLPLLGILFIVKAPRSIYDAFWLTPTSNPADTDFADCREVPVSSLSSPGEQNTQNCTIMSTSQALINSFIPSNQKTAVKIQDSSQ